MHRRDLIALSGMVLASTAGCLESIGLDAGPTASANPSNPEARIDPAVDDGVVNALADANTAFAFDVYEQLIEEAPDADHLLSPFSVSMALAMTWAGARGETESEMADVLNFPMGQDELHEAFNALDRELASRSETEVDGGEPPELNIANAIWPQAGFELHEPFRQTMGEHYGANPVELDYSGDAAGAADTINDWVATETEGRIDDLVSAANLPPDTKLVLTNAIYLLASWLDPFEEEDTHDAIFEAIDGSTDEVAMMSMERSLLYATFDGHQAIELPYEGEEVSMVVLLPEVGRLAELEGYLDGDTFAEVVDAFERTHGRIELPRFEMETSYSLPEALEALGMERAFGGGADFSGIADAGLFIDDVLHDAFIAVDEEGTEAAAATAVIMPESAPPEPAFEMRCDRPFLYVIRDRSTGSVLFMGRVAAVPDDPS